MTEIAIVGAGEAGRATPGATDGAIPGGLRPQAPAAARARRGVQQADITCAASVG